MIDLITTVLSKAPLILSIFLAIYISYLLFKRMYIRYFVYDDFCKEHGKYIFHNLTDTESEMYIFHLLYDLYYQIKFIAKKYNKNIKLFFNDTTVVAAVDYVASSFLFLSSLQLYLMNLTPSDKFCESFTVPTMLNKELDIITSPRIRFRLDQDCIKILWYNHKEKDGQVLLRYNLDKVYIPIIDPTFDFTMSKIYPTVNSFSVVHESAFSEFQDPILNTNMSIYNLMKHGIHEKYKMFLKKYYEDPDAFFINYLDFSKSKDGHYKLSMNGGFIKFIIDKENNKVIRQFILPFIMEIFYNENNEMIIVDKTYTNVTAYLILFNALETKEPLEILEDINKLREMNESFIYFIIS